MIPAISGPPDSLSSSSFWKTAIQSARLPCHLFVTSQGSASGRFARAVQQRNLFMAEVALEELGNPSLLIALDYIVLLSELKPEMSLEESRLALNALEMLCAGDQEVVPILQRLLRRVSPLTMPRLA
jgi:hypothetical protein